MVMNSLQKFAKEVGAAMCLCILFELIKEAKVLFINIFVCLGSEMNIDSCACSPFIDSALDLIFRTSVIGHKHANKAYSSQNQCKCDMRERLECVHELNTNVKAVLEEKCVDGFLNDWMFVKTRFRLVIDSLRLRESTNAGL